MQLTTITPSPLPEHPRPSVMLTARPGMLEPH
jgi:hypothetical protein